MLQPFEIMWQQKVMQRCVALKIVVANRLACNITFNDTVEGVPSF